MLNLFKQKLNNVDTHTTPYHILHHITPNRTEPYHTTPNYTIPYHLTDSDIFHVLVMAVEESEKIVQGSLNEFENPKNCGTTCTAGIVWRRKLVIKRLIQLFKTPYYVIQLFMYNLIT